MPSQAAKASSIVEMLRRVRANKAAGPHVGLIFQVHFFLDDIFPNSIGRPIFQ